MHRMKGNCVWVNFLNFTNKGRHTHSSQLSRQGNIGKLVLKVGREATKRHVGQLLMISGYYGIYNGRAQSFL